MKQRNYAATLPAEKAQLAVQPAPFPTSSGENELIIENQVVAVNPVDWKIQDSGGSFNISYPAVLGEDVAGKVLHVGSKIKKFKVGDRVIAHASGLGRGSVYGGFQLYPTINAALTAVVPEYIPLESAAVLPLSISTAAAGLYLKTTLSLRYPTLTSDNRYGQDSSRSPATLLLWGGSSSVGSSVIQLATASGYRVVTTASPSNYAYCKSLGATYVLDYHNPDIVSIVIAVLRAVGTEVVGAYDAIGSETTVRQSASILHALGGGGTIASVVSAPEDLPKGIKVARIGSGNIVSQEPEVAAKVWGEYIPAALEAGKFVPSPEPLVVGTGLQSVQKGLDRQKQGVSARKVEIVL